MDCSFSISPYLRDVDKKEDGNQKWLTPKKGWGRWKSVILKMNLEFYINYDVDNLYIPLSGYNSS